MAAPRWLRRGVCGSPILPRARGDPQHGPTHELTPCLSLLRREGRLKTTLPTPPKRGQRGLCAPVSRPPLPAPLTLAPRSVAEVRSETCEEFYSLAARGNLELLPRGSARRRAILHGALACVVSGRRAAGSALGMVRVSRAGHRTSTTSLSQGASSSRLRPEQLGSLGALVCDMEPDTITASDPGILENLKLCTALTGAQRGALNAALLGGGTAYG